MRDSGTSLTLNPRIAIGGIWHETNTFASDVTRYSDFESCQFALEQELIDLYSNTNTELGGMISESNKVGFDPVPTLFAAAVPSGIIEQDSFLRLVDELTGLIRKSLPLDGVALALHGAAAAEHFDDADAYILERVRQVVGNQTPIVATFDYHANLSESMVQNASALIGYDTYPHVDMADRGAESVRVISRLIKDKSTLRCAFRKLPLLTSPLNQQTDVAPMLEVMQRLHELESNPAITCKLTDSISLSMPIKSDYKDSREFNDVCTGIDGYKLQLVRHSVGDYVCSLAHANGLESFPRGFIPPNCSSRHTELNLL